MFVTGVPLRCSLVYGGENGAPERKAPALPANVRLDWKCCPWTNTLAYYDKYEEHVEFVSNQIYY